MAAAGGAGCRFEARFPTPGCSDRTCPAGGVLPLASTWWAAPGWLDAMALSSPHLARAEARPFGQCLDHAGLLSALLRAVGIPSRMVACWGCGGWNYHAWAEAWLNEVDPRQWSVAGATPGELIRAAGDPGTATRRAAYALERVGEATAIYGYEFSGGGGARADLSPAYSAAAAVVLDGTAPLAAGFGGLWGGLLAPGGAASASTEGLTITMDTDLAEYLVGDPVLVSVTIDNSGRADAVGELELRVELAYPEHSQWTYVDALSPERLNVPSGARVERSYRLDSDSHRDTGTLRLLATFAGAEAEWRVEIQSGYELSLQLPERVTVGQEYPVALEVTNRLSEPLADLDMVLLAPLLDGGVESLHRRIDALLSGETRRLSFDLRATDEGLSVIRVTASSPRGGVERRHAIAAVVGDARLELEIGVTEGVLPGRSLPCTFTVSNRGGAPASDVEVELVLPEGWRAEEGARLTLAELPAGESIQITRTLWPTSGGDGAGGACARFGGAAGRGGGLSPTGRARRWRGLCRALQRRARGRGRAAGRGAPRAAGALAQALANSGWAGVLWWLTGGAGRAVGALAQARWWRALEGTRGCTCRCLA